MRLLPSIFSYVLDDMMYQVMVGYILRTDILITVAHTFIALTMCHMLYFMY